ncbi:MAG: HD domain-containing protein, partial [Planctomycetes bacterium]|nr:HD domain-containing protein [Planctomycetota bacterium]
DTAQFQRLRGIKQLGTASLVFPGAVHTRFEHSIGVLHMVEQFVAAANRNAARSPSDCRRVDDAERRLIRIAALVHDVTHIPFGHNIEDQTGLLPRHDVADRYRAAFGDTEIGAVLERLGVRDAVLDVLGAGGTDLPAFCRQMLSDTIDADLLDYLRRDAHYTGLELRYDDRVREYFRIDRGSERMFVDCAKQGMLREDIVSELTRVLEIRYHFSERVYYHHAKIAAGALLARMVELALRGGALTAEALQSSTDESLLGQLERAQLDSAADTERLGRYVERFRRRALPKRVLVLPFYLNEAVQQELLDTWFRPGAPEARLAWEAEREAEARSRFGHDVDITMYCPARRMQLKEARTLVRIPGESGRIVELADIADDVPRLRDLQASYPRLWKLYVFASAADRDERRELQRMCLDALPGGSVNALLL